MKKIIFITRRQQPLQSWKEAFPRMEIRTYADLGARLAAPGTAIIFFYIDNHLENPASYVTEIRQATPGCAVVVLSNVPQDDEGLAVLEAGAAGYTGAVAVAEVLRNIETVVQSGGIWVGPDLLRRMLLALNKQAGAALSGARLDVLSPREREVALAVACGATNKEVARQLDITERTVKAHMHQIFETLKVRDRLQLAIYINGLPQTTS